MRDSHLMAALAGGDMGALGELVRRHQGKTMSLAMRMLGRHHEAEDVCQEAFLRVFRASDSFIPSAAFTTWLYRIVVNLCHDAIRRRKSSAPELKDDVLADSQPDPCQSAQQEETGRMVRLAISRLPQRQREAVVLHRYQQLGHEDVAQVMGCSASAVESLLVRAYKQLRTQLRNCSEYERRATPRLCVQEEVEQSHDARDGQAVAGLGVYMAVRVAAD